MMYVQHPQHLHMQHHQHQQQQSVQMPHPGLSCQHQDPMNDPFATSATNYSNYASHGLNRFQHHRPNPPPSAVQQQQQQQLLHGGQYVSPGYYVSYSQQMTPTTLTPADPRDLGDRSAIVSPSSSAASSSSSSPSAAESSPLQWTKAQDYACAPAPTSAGSSLVFYGTGSHMTEWTGDALTSVGATTNVCHQQQQLFPSVAGGGGGGGGGGVAAAGGGEEDDLHLGQRNLPLCLTGNNAGGSSFLSHPPDIRVSTRLPPHSIAALQQGYSPTTHHHLQPIGGSVALGQRSPQSQPLQVSGSQVVSMGQQGSSADELRMRGTVVGGGGEGGGGRMVNQSQAPPFDWMKRQTYPITPSSGKTRTKDKYRIVYSEHQKVELEKEFLYNPYITIQRKGELAGIIGLSDRQVKIWFQNRRAKDRKQKKKRPQATTSGSNAPTALQLPPGQPSKAPIRHPEATTPVSVLGGAQLYPLPPSAPADRNGPRGRSVVGSMKPEPVAGVAAGAGARSLLPTEVKCGEVKSESMAPV